MLIRKLTSELIGNGVLKKSTEIRIAVAMASDWAYERLKNNLNPNAKVRIILGLDLPTSTDLLKKILNENIWDCRINTSLFFHPKFYSFKMEDGISIAYIGSGNFTKGGWGSNDELFVKVNTESQNLELINWFEEKWIESKNITLDIIQRYEAILPKIEENEKANASEIVKLKDFLNENLNYDNIDFTDMFFSKEHHQTFLPIKRHKEDALVESERIDVRNRLYELDSLLTPALPLSWNISHHFKPDNIVATIDLQFHVAREIGALWVAYGRDRNALKAYSENATPLDFMRLQVIIHDYDIGIWLMPGKDNGSQIDREYFLTNMREDLSYRESFYNLLTNLGDQYWIKIADDTRLVTSFQNSMQLFNYCLRDNWRVYYFIIGRDYPIGSPELTTSQIINTIIRDFGKYIPLYNLIKDKTFG
jgi:hypothetical protein